MKKLLLLPALVLLLFACSRKLVATTPAKASTETVRVKPPAAAPTDTVSIMGKAVYINRCGRCHRYKPVAKYTADEWVLILKTMIPKARLAETEAAQVTAYVLGHAKKPKAGTALYSSD